MGWLGTGFPPVDPSRAQDEIGSVSFIHLSLASLSLVPVPFHSSGWCSHFLKALGPQPPCWLLVVQRPAKKEQEMKAGSPGCRCEGCRARSREGSAWWLSKLGFSCLCSSVHHSRTGQAEGQTTGGPETNFPSAWGTSQHFSVGHILN